jgi:hypothetical protein
MTNMDVPYGYCECHCGARTNLAPYTYAKYGWIKGEPLRFIHGHNKLRLGTDRWTLIPELGCHRWYGALTGAGYGAFRVGDRLELAHVWFYNQAHPDHAVASADELDHVCHSRDRSCPGGSTCLHRRCVNVEHLEPIPHEQNIQRGRNSKLVPAQVRAILTIGRSQPLRMIAAQYGMSSGQISNILSGYSWHNLWLEANG